MVVSRGSKVDSLIFMHSLYDYKHLLPYTANMAKFTDKCRIYSEILDQIGGFLA